MNKKELNKILEDHKLWVESKGEKGKRAYLAGLNLEGAKLEGAKLRGADLFGAKLRGAKFTIEIRDAMFLPHCSVTKDQLPWLALHPKFSEFYPTLKVSDTLLT